MLQSNVEEKKMVGKHFLVRLSKLFMLFFPLRMRAAAAAAGTTTTTTTAATTSAAATGRTTTTTTAAADLFFVRDRAQSFE